MRYITFHSYMISITFHSCVIYHILHLCDPSYSISVWSIIFHIYVNYHPPYLCDPSYSIPTQSITFHICMIYHLLYLCDLLPSISIWTTIFHIYVIYQYSKVQDNEPHLYKALYCVTCKFWICCFVLVICTEMWSTALELPFRGCTCTTACCCMYCWRTLICCSSWFSKMSVCGASGWFRIWMTQLY
jgi:hypothetical protein